MLIPIFEKKFSENSYGFRPNRNTHQAILRCKKYRDEGYPWAVYIDLEEYFDTVNHDKSAERVMKSITKFIEVNICMSLKMNVMICWIRLWSR